MSEKLIKEDAKFTIHRPTDTLDPGFTLKGKKLYFISAKKTENTPGRPWEIIRKNNIPQALLEHVRRYNPTAFTEQNDSYRVGDLILAMAPDEHLEPFRRQRAEANAEQLSAISAAPQGSQVEVSDDSSDLSPEFFRK